MSADLVLFTPERLLPTRLQAAHQTVVDRAGSGGASGLILTGSTARSTRTPIGDLDYLVIGARLSTRDLPEELDVHAMSTSRFRELVALGDDYAHWSLRFGHVLIDDGVLHKSRRRIVDEGLWPDIARKRAQAERSVRTAMSRSMPCPPSTSLPNTSGAHRTSSPSLVATRR